MPDNALFVEARARFHAALLKKTLTIDRTGIPSNADSGNPASIQIAKNIADLLRAETRADRGAGQTLEMHLSQSVRASYRKRS